MVNWFKSLLSYLSQPPHGRYIRWAGVDWDTGGSVTSGVTVNDETALTYAAVWCATRVISESVSGLPCIIYRRLPNNRGRERAPEHPLYDLLHRRPNPEMNAVAFWDILTKWLVNAGSARCEIIFDGTGRPSKLWPLHPSCVRSKRREDRSLYYEITDEIGSVRHLNPDSVLNIPGALTDDGIDGRGVIRQARESIGMGLATEQYGAGFFGNGARPGGILTHPGNPSKDAENNMRTGWENMHRGAANSNRTALLREGTTYTALGLAPEDSQFLETRQHNVTEVARWYRIPPHKLMDLMRATFSNIEDQSRNFYADSVMPWLRRIEAACMFQLFDGDDDHYVEFLVDGALRGDSKSRTEAAVQQFMNGALTLNQWCAMENRNAIEGEGGDTHFVPVNLVPLDRALKEPEPPPVSVIQQPSGKGPEPKGDDTKQQRASLATKAVIDYELGRLTTKEINAVRRAGNTPSEFLEKVESFYTRHRNTMTEALMPAVTAHLVAIEADRVNIDRHVDHIVEKHIDSAMEDILKAAECSAADLPEAIRALTETWKKGGDDASIESESRLVACDAA